MSYTVCCFSRVFQGSEGGFRHVVIDVQMPFFFLWCGREFGFIGPSPSRTYVEALLLP